MAINFLKQRWQRVLLSIAGLLLLVICILGIAINFYFSPKLDQKLKETVLTGTDSLYTLSFSTAHLHVMQGKIVINNLVLQPDTEVYNRRKKLNLAPNNLYQVKIKRLVIKHIHPVILYFKRKLDIEQLEITEPEILVNYEQNRDQDTVTENKRTAYQRIAKVLKSIHIQSILLNDVKLKYVNHDGAKADSMAFKELNLVATDFLIDSASQFSRSRFLFCDDVSADLNNYEGNSDDRQYSYQIKKIQFSTRSSELNITGMDFGPTLPPDGFFKSNKGAYYSVRLDSLRLSKFDFKTYSKYHKLFATKLTLANGSLDVLANPAPADSITDRGPNFPQMLLKQLNIDLKIDTTEAKNISIYYTGYNKKSGKRGTVNFTNTSGYIFNITNNAMALQKNSFATAQLQTYFMNNSRLNADFTFKLDDEDMPFSYKGSMEAIDLKKVNPVAMPLGMVKISSGKVKQVSFNYQANRYTAHGRLLVLYNDLRIALLKRDGNDQLKKMGIISLFANALVIKRDNPANNEAPRTGEVAMLRKPQWSIFTFMWKTLLVGLKECAGYDTQTEQTVKQKIIEFKQNKQTHDARKAIRLQNRADRRAKRELKKRQKIAEQAAGTTPTVQDVP